MKRKKVKRWLSLSAIALAMMVTVTGCRPSPILEDILYTADAAELDPDRMATEDVQDGDEKSSHEDKKDEEGERTDDTETESAGKADPDGSTDVDAKDTKLTKDTSNGIESDESFGDGSGQDEENGNTGTGDGSENGSDTSGDGIGEGSGTSSTDEEDPNDKTDDTGEGNNVSVPSKADVPKKVVTDANGIEQVIPEDVYTVTAVGPVASMIEMLGGTGRLLGSSESFTESSLAKTLFSDIEDIYTWWEDAGENAISDEDFNALLQESPDVCFEISGQNTFTEDQVARLKELEIGYLVLPELSTTDDLKNAVTIVAKALNTNESNGKSAINIASQYAEWVDDTVKEVEKVKNGSVQYFTMYIKDYREDISFSFEDAPYEQNDPSILPDNVSHSGVAVMNSPTKESILSECLEAGGIKLPGKYIYSSPNGVDLKQKQYSNIEKWINYDPNVAQDMLVHPFYGLYGNISYTGNTSTYIYPDSWSEYHYTFVQGGAKGSNYYKTAVALGQSQAPVLVVANQKIKEQIENDFYWQFHGVVVTGGNSEFQVNPPSDYWLYYVELYPDKPWLYDTDYVNGIKTALSRDGKFPLSFLNYGGGFLSDDFLSASVDGVSDYTTYSKCIRSGIWDNYKICVSPAGIDNWAEGGLETPLEAYWAANKISGTISESLLLNRVRGFYKTFFGVTLTDSQLKEIIG